MVVNLVRLSFKLYKTKLEYKVERNGSHATFLNLDISIDKKTKNENGMKKLVPSLGSNCLTLNLKKLIREGSIQIVSYSRKVGKTSSVFLEVTIPLITLKLTLEGGMLHITYICILLRHLTTYVYIYTNT